MTAAPIVPGPHDAVATTAAAALAAVLPSSEQLEPGNPQPGTEHVTSLFSAAVVADLGGPISGRVGVLVADELTSALSSSPMGQLDLAAAVQPALDAAAAALGGSAQPGRTVDLDEVVADMGGDFTAVPLLGSTIFAAVLVPDSTLSVAASTTATGTTQTPTQTPTRPTTARRSRPTHPRPSARRWARSRSPRCRRSPGRRSRATCARSRPVVAASRCSTGSRWRSPSSSAARGWRCATCSRSRRAPCWLWTGPPGARPTCSSTGG